MYTGKKKAFMGSLEYYALSQQNKQFFLFNNNNKKNKLCSLSQDHCFWCDFFQLTFLFIQNKAIIISRTLGRLLFEEKFKTRPLCNGKGTK